ncbi:MAG: hypothetical protein WC956_06485, partial [bacterium]
MQQPLNGGNQWLKSHDFAEILGSQRVQQGEQKRVGAIRHQPFSFSEAGCKSGDPPCSSPVLR